MSKKQNAIIESLGIYLPPDSYSTKEVLLGCKNEFRFPLENITGIKNRRMAGQNEFAIDLARKAVNDCLDRSRFNPSDIDMLIYCGISRMDSSKSFSFEPNTSVKLKKEFGFSNAIVFDVTNACAGMFTGLYIIDALLKTGAIKTGMIVSGEYITHLTDTAQREIESFMDSRIACLTLGDAGAAMILEKGVDDKIGFQDIQLQTMGQYSHFCIGKESETGGWIMYTDAVNMTEVGLKSGVEHALDTLKQNAWSPYDFKHLIMHQTSKTSLNGAVRLINQLLNDKVCNDNNTFNNLENRGNTASTSHFVALMDGIREKKINSGDKLVFSINASGITIGTALYQLDELPKRIQNEAESASKSKLKDSHQKKTNSISKFDRFGVRVESIGVVSKDAIVERNSLKLLENAVQNCLRNSTYEGADIDLIIYCGIYRSEYLMEPAYATFIAGSLANKIKASGSEINKILAFDIFNGSLGFLNACHIVQQLLKSGNCKIALVVTSEIENNFELFPDKLLGVQETASAMILDAHQNNGLGMSCFEFKYSLDSMNSYTSSALSSLPSNPNLFMNINKADDINEKYIVLILSAVEDFLLNKKLRPEEINFVFPPQISSNFISELDSRLEFPNATLIDAVGEDPDLFTSSIPYSFECAYNKGLVSPGDTALIIAVGSGIQVGCAIYNF